MGYSAEVRMALAVNGCVLDIAQLGPNFLTLRNPVEHNPTLAEITMSIDGRESRWNVYLPDGISATDSCTRIVGVK